MVMESAMQRQIEGAQETYASMSEEIHHLQESNAGLLAALQEIASGTYDTWTQGYQARQIAIAAITKATRGGS